MLGFSLGKLLFTLAAIVVVWMAFKHAGRLLGESRRDGPSVSGRQRRQPSATKSSAPREDSPATVDLVPCPECGSYIVRGGTCNCGYEDRG